MSEPERHPFAGPISRRELLRAAALGSPGLIGAYLLACRSGSSKQDARATSTPVGNATLVSQTMRWERLLPAEGAAAPPARFDHSLVSDGGRLYLFGGRTPASLADFWVYGIASNTWTDLTDFGPQPRFGHNAVWDSGRNVLVLFGGQDGATFFDDVWEYDPARTLWTQVTFAGGVPAARYGAGAAFDQAGHLLMTHGFTTQGRFDDTWEYDVAAHAWNQVSPATGRPVRRCLMRAVWDSLKQRVLIFGGQTDGTPFLDDFWSWSPLTEWQQLAREPHPPQRALYAMVFHDDAAQVILFGGNTDQGPVDDLWAFHSSGENWTRIPTSGGDAPQPRYSHDAAIASQEPTIFMFGGNDGAGPLRDLWRLAPAPA